MKRMLVVIIIIVVVAAAVVGFLVWNRPPMPAVGEAFPSESVIGKRMKSLGYLEMGQFSPGWPATITEVVEQVDGITFTIRGHSPHVYEHEAYVGYGFVFFRLVSTKNGTEFGYLYKTKDKIK